MNDLTDDEVAELRAILDGIGCRYSLDFVIVMFSRHGCAGVLSATNGNRSGSAETCETMKDVICNAIAKTGVPVVAEENADGSRN